jgi:acyl-CoA synthetase (NDP forming)
MGKSRRNDLDAFFYPDAVAVLGPFRDWDGLGCGVIRNMMGLGYTGRIYAVSRSVGEVAGLKAYPSVAEIPGPVDLAVVITPARTVPDVVRQCADKGTRAAVVVSENFAESGEEGAMLQGELVQAAREKGIRVMGPNTIGVLNTANNLVTTPFLIG